MSELDLIIERLTYLRLWFGVLVVTDISLSGWIMLHLGTPQTLLLASAVITVIAITVVLYFVHRLIVRLTDSLRDL